MPKNRVRVFHQGRTMSSINSISPDKLARLISVPHCRTLIDVRTERDYEADPRLLPVSLRRRLESVSAWASEFVGRPVIIVIDQSGEQVSEGVAAWLRHAGASSYDVLAGGRLAWVKSGGPLIPSSKAPQCDVFGRDAPVLTSVNLWSFALSVASAVAIFRFRVGMLQTLAGSCARGMGLFLRGEI